MDSMEATRISKDDSTAITTREDFSLGSVKELDTKPKHDRPCDVTLVVSDEGKAEFKAHRDLLAEASPFFEKLFNSDMKEKDEGIVRLGVVSESVVRDFLNFLYTGSVEILALQHAEELIVAADYLLFSNVKNFAGRFLAKTVCFSNCISYLDFAEKYHCEELVDFTNDFIHANFPAVAECEEFLNLSSEEVERWISSDEINVSAEENVFEIICRWIKQNKEDRSPKFNELFRHVRLVDMSREYLSKKVLEESLVKNDKQCLTSVTSAISWLDPARKAQMDLPTPQSTRKSLKKYAVVVAWGKIVCYLPDTKTWYELPKSPSELDRNIDVLASSGDKVDKITFKSPFHVVERYDPRLNRWSSLTMPRIPDSTERVRMAVTVIGEDVYADMDSDIVWKYSQRSGSWQSFPLPSYRPCVVFEGKFVYSMGGLLGDKMATTRCIRLDTVENERKELAPMQTARFKANGVAARGKIFVLGGLTKTTKHGDLTPKLLLSCEVYSVETNEWHFIASLPNVHGLCSKSINSVLYRGTKLYSVGRQILCDPEISPVLICYNIERNRWTRKPIPVTAHCVDDDIFCRISACSIGIPKRILESFRKLEFPTLAPTVGNNLFI